MSLPKWFDEYRQDHRVSVPRVTSDKQIYQLAKRMLSLTRKEDFNKILQEEGIASAESWTQLDALLLFCYLGMRGLPKEWKGV